MTIFLTFIFGVIAGFIVHAVTIIVSFKQRTIDNKIKVYDSIIARWVLFRNFIYSQLPKNPNEHPDFDKMYGESQTFIGEAILVSEDTNLTQDIDKLNEKFYSTLWSQIPIEKANEIMEGIKQEAIPIIKRMQEDIKRSTIFQAKDFIYILKGFFQRDNKK